MPEVSVIIPAYNCEFTIGETIQSVREQTFQDFELIVINNGSKDRTMEVIQNIEDKRLKIFVKENDLVSKARNRGIAHSTGEYVAFLNADDLWTSDKLERQLATLKQHPEAGVAYSWTCFMDVHKQTEALLFYPSPPYSFEGNVYEKLLISDFIHSGSNTLIRREAIEQVGEFDTALKVCEDWDYWLRLAAHWHFVVVPKYQILYRRTPGSMSSKVEEIEKETPVTMQKAYREAPLELQYLKSHTITNFHRYCASLYLQHRDDLSGVKQAGQHLWLAICMRPQILLNKLTQKLLTKFLLKRVFTPRIANYLLMWMRKPFAIQDPRLKS